MTRCDECRPKLLDYQYGLLDVAEAVAVKEHLADCPACGSARVETDRFQDLLSKAAKGVGPDITFTPPAHPTVAVKTATPTTPSEQAGRTGRSVVTRWAVAAGLLLAVAAVAGSAAQDVVGYAWHKPTVDRHRAQYEAATAERDRVYAEQAAARAAAQEKYAAARKAHDELVAGWAKAEEAARTAAASRPFTVDVRGPAVPLPGAPNEYAIRVTDRDGKPFAAPVEAAVKDHTGRVVHARTFPVNHQPHGGTLKLPPDMWAGVPPGADLFLHVSAVDAQTGAKSELTEKVRLAEPVFTTFLTTDKPMYRPGETVFFRSLTLDRTHFLPPKKDQTLRFELRGPSGQVVPGCELVGRAKPAALRADGTMAAISGPNGHPVHGVGSGAFALPGDLSGGEYTLNVHDLPPNASQPTDGAKPLATRRFSVNKYTPDRLLKTLEFDAKTYGPGDVVLAKFAVTDQGKPCAGVGLRVNADANGRPVTGITAPTKTGPDGTAAIRLTLPKADEITEARLTITVTAGGVAEALVRRIPLTTRKLNLEFFPEGGDLIAGVPNRVYFRATTSFGKPADVQGVLTDGTRDVCSLRTLTDADQPGTNQGLGAFSFTPEPGRRYAVRLHKPLGILQPLVVPTTDGSAALFGATAAAGRVGYPLPEAKPDGVTLTVPDGVTTPGRPIRLTVWSAGAKRALLVGAYVRNQPVAHARVTAEPGKPTEVVLNPGEIKLGGVTRVTVFEDPDGDEEPLKPVAERLVFRRPGETLKLGFAALNGDGTPRTGPFTPGSPVRLDITVATEADAPTPAVLWAAVVNQSVLTMADEKSARLLPTHFLLGGEVRGPDELENADFLLTDHPKAGEALDLLLGTQGWRRFAEQAPDQFRKRTPAEDADRLLVVSAGRGPVPLGWRDSTRKVFDDHWPKYEAALAELDAAQAQQTGAVAELMPRVRQAEAAWAAAQAAFYTANANLEQHREGLAWWLTHVVIPVVVLGIVGVVTRRLMARKVSVAAMSLIVGCAILVGISAIGTLGSKTSTTFALVGSASAPITTGRSPGMLPQSDIRPDAEVTASDPVDASPRIAALAAEPKPLKGRPLALQSGTVKPRMTVRSITPPGISDPRAPAGPAGREPTALPQPVPPAAGLFRPLPELAEAAQIAASPDFSERVTALARDTVHRAPPLVVREYAHTRSAVAAGDPARTDFAETLLWQPVLVVPESGKASVSFALSDAIAPYQVLVAGHTLDGRIGAVTGRIEVRKPFAVDPKLPQEIGSADKLDMPVIASNGTAEARTAKLTVNASSLVIECGPAERTIALPAGETGRAVVRVAPATVDGKLTVRVDGTAGPGLIDSVERTLTVVPDGFPIGGSAADVLDKSFAATVPQPTDRLPGTLRVAVTVYPNTLSEIQAGLDGLLREPGGCFEQTSTSNYPNVLIAEYLKENDQLQPEVSRRARELMDRGYQRLTGFECPDTPMQTRKGFEWFGAADAPHEALTAYGLLQFTDMSRVHPVDPVMLRRTKQFLLDGRDGNGGFRRKQAAHGAWGSTPDYLTDAYTVWAITEADRRSNVPADLSRELDALTKLAADGKPAKDPYFLALVANALLNHGRADDGVALLKTMAGLQAKDGSVPGAETSITRSGGRDLVIETTALAVLGWLKVGRAELFGENARTAVGWVAKQRGGYGGFGSTQSTVLALKALVAHAKQNKHPAESGELRVFVNGAMIGTKPFRTDTPGPIAFEVPNPDAAFPAGKATEVRVETTAKQAYPVTVGWECRARTPDSSPECPIRLSTTLDKTELAEGDTAKFAVRVENVADRGHGMVVAIVGIPAGLKLPEDLKQFRDLTAKPADGGEPTVSYWETRGRELILYWRGLAPKQAVAFGIDLIADTPGEYRGPASRAYLYYHAEPKQWAEPVSVRVRAK